MIRAVVFDTDTSVRKLINLYKREFLAVDYSDLCAMYSNLLHGNLCYYEHSYTLMDIRVLLDNHIVNMCASHVLYNIMARLVDNTISGLLVELPNIRQISSVLVNGFKCTDDLRRDLNLTDDVKDTFLIENNHAIMLLINGFTDIVYENNKEEFIFILMEITEKIRRQFTDGYNANSINVVFVNDNYNPMMVFSSND